MSVSIKSYLPISFSATNCRISRLDLENFSRLALSEDGSFGAFMIGAKTISLFSIEEQKNQNKLETKEIGKPIELNHPITMMSFGPRKCRTYSGSSPDPKIRNPDSFFFATGHANGSILLWDTTGLLVSQMLDHDRAITGLVFSPRQSGIVQMLSVALDGKLKVWDFEQALIYNMCQTKVHCQPLHCLDWAEGGHLVATAGTGLTVHVYRMSMKIGEKLLEFKGHLSCVVSCKFSADATTLVTASLDTRVNLWDCLNGQLRQTLCHTYPVPQFIFGQAQVRSVGVTRSGGSVITLNDDRKLNIWNPLKMTTDVESPAELPCRIPPPMLPLRITPEFTLNLRESDSQHSFVTCRGGHWIGVSSLNGDSFRIHRLEVGSDLPKLSDLCRNSARKAIAFRHDGVDLLPVPRPIRDFVNFDHKSIQNHFQIHYVG